MFHAFSPFIFAKPNKTRQTD